jgi:integrase
MDNPLSWLAQRGELGFLSILGPLVRLDHSPIGRAHIGAGLLNPCSGEAVRLGLKQMGRETSARQAQARALGWKEIREFIGSAGKGLRADRERALLCVAYESLARRGELVAVKVRDIEFWPNGTGQALIRRGKTDAEGQGRVAYLSRETVKWLKIWLEKDLAELDIDLAAITQAGGWKSTRMPLQYAEKINAARSGLTDIGFLTAVRS